MNDASNTQTKIQANVAQNRADFMRKLSQWRAFICVLIICLPFVFFFPREIRIHGHGDLETVWQPIWEEVNLVYYKLELKRMARDLYVVSDWGSLFPWLFVLIPVTFFVWNFLDQRRWNVGIRKPDELTQKHETK